MKKLLLFFFAAFSLLMTGILLNDDFSINKLLLLFIGTLCGIILIYDIKPVDKSKGFIKKSFGYLSCYKHSTFIILLLLLIPIGYIYLSTVSFLAMAIAGVLGVAYSVTIKFGKSQFRLKEIILLKNLLIGLAWGLLVTAGAGSLEDNIVLLITILASIQVLIGSVIRDLSDKEIDKLSKVKTLPVIFGKQKTVQLLQFINFSSLTLLLVSNENVNFTILLMLIVLWRFVNLYKLTGNYYSKLWGQTINLLTCVLFLFITFIQYLWK